MSKTTNKAEMEMNKENKDTTKTNKDDGAAAEENEDDRMYHCAQCGDAAELGAIDEDDGQWYCKACWEAFQAEVEEEADEGEAAEEGKDGEEKPAAATEEPDSKAAPPVPTKEAPASKAEEVANSNEKQDQPSVEVPDDDDEEERMYVCNECGESPPLGAIDPEDDQWYCKDCWEAFTRDSGRKTPAQTPIGSSGRASFDLGKESPAPDLSSPAKTSPVMEPKKEPEAPVEKAADTAEAPEAASKEEGADGDNGDDVAEVDEDRMYTCADCGEAAELGAIDDDDGQWYCKNCWEKLLEDGEGDAGEDAAGNAA